MISYNIKIFIDSIIGILAHSSYREVSDNIQWAVDYCQILLKRFSKHSTRSSIPVSLIDWNHKVLHCLTNTRPHLKLKFPQINRYEHRSRYICKRDRQVPHLSYIAENTTTNNHWNPHRAFSKADTDSTIIPQFKFKEA